MTKMDMIWTATANLIHSKVASTFLITGHMIKAEVNRIWNVKITHTMLYKHLVSWENRKADKNNPKRGGSRNRYLFRTINGNDPDSKGDFRLYKKQDTQYDGRDKSGPVCPQAPNVDPAYSHLVQWYLTNYY
jgi:hypothetical protein